MSLIGHAATLHFVSNKLSIATEPMSIKEQEYLSLMLKQVAQDIEKSENKEEE